MHQTWQVMRQELATTFRRTTFIIFAFIVPVVIALVFAIVQIYQEGGQAGIADVEAASAEDSLQAEGFVDPSGLIRIMPDNLPEGALIRFDTEDQARQALQTGQVAGYYIVPPDYVAEGKVYHVIPDDRSMISSGQDWIMEWTLLVNVLGGDQALADRVWAPAWNLQEFTIAPPSRGGLVAGEDCSRPGSACQSNELIKAIPAILVFVFYLTITISSSLLFNSIAVEKENRTIEVLLLSVSPRQLLVGKILALAIAGLLQTAVWLAATYTSFTLGGSTLDLPAGFTFPVPILVWGLAFFLGGYGIYASLMAGAGAMVPRLKESGAATMIVLFPLVVGYMIGLLAPLTGSTQGAWIIGLSLFPLTAPVVMVMRLTDGFVPLWELLCSAFLVYATAVVCMRSAAAMFRAQNLLSGQPFSARTFFKALVGQV